MSSSQSARPQNGAILMIPLMLLFLSCSAPARRLHIDLITDFAAGFEFDRIFVLIDDGGEFPLTTTVPIAFDADYIRGERIFSPRAPSTREVRILVRLEYRGGTIAEQGVIVAVGEASTTVTVKITRDCRGVACPTRGNPTFDACLAGMCVDPRCTVETPQFCPPPACVENEDCTVPLCADPVCISGICLAAAVHERCEPGFFCDATAGCRPEPPRLDGGVDLGSPDAGDDAGTLDAGDDAGTLDAGTDAGTLDAGDDAGTLDAGDDLGTDPCADGSQSAGETDVDCGGPTCAACANGLECLDDADCAIEICTDFACRPPQLL